MDKLKVYIWSKGFEEFYSTGLYVASGHSKEEAANKLAKLKRTWTWDWHTSQTKRLENRIRELETGTGPKSSWASNPGHELNMVKNNLERHLKYTLDDYEKMNDELEQGLFDRLMKNESEEVNPKNLVVFSEGVG